MTVTTTTLRVQILTALKARTEATLKQIAQATTERNTPSRVTNELNKMRAEALVECAKKPGKNELWYWLATPDPIHGSDTQPAVVKNTGSSASVQTPVSPPAEGAAVQPDPELATGKQALPVASSADDTDAEPIATQHDSRAGAFACDSSSVDLESVLSMQRVEIAVLNADLDNIRDLLASVIDEVLDPTDFCEVELATMAAEKIAEQADTIHLLQINLTQKEEEMIGQDELVIDLRARLRNETNLVEKLEHLLQSARHEADHLRPYAGADMVNHPPHYQGKVECIDAIESALGHEGFAAYCRGSAIKYTWRAGKKGPAQQDLAKAAWYTARALGTNSEAPL